MKWDISIHPSVDGWFKPKPNVPTDIKVWKSFDLDPVEPERGKYSSVLGGFSLLTYIQFASSWYWLDVGLEMHFIRNGRGYKEY